MNKHKAIMELQSVSQMQQSIVAALRCLDEWEWNSAEMDMAMKLLRIHSKDLEKEAGELADVAAGGKVDMDAAMEEEE